MNPYEILGVTKDATDDEIKAKYRKLVKKYHPDRYEHGSKAQADATEKLKQVNAAYDMVIKIKEGNFNWSGSPQFANIRAAIQRGAVNEAESMLTRMTERPAEWHYLMGIVLLRRGWYDGAVGHFRTANQMDPSNKEYEQALHSMTQSAGMYANFGDDDERTVNLNSPLCRICGCVACLACCGSNYFCPWICCC